MDVGGFGENWCIGLWQSNLNAGHSSGQTLSFMFSPSCLLNSQAVALVSGFTFLAPSQHVSNISWSTGGYSELIVILGDGGWGVGGVVVCSISQNTKTWKHSSEEWTSIISFLGGISSWRYIRHAPSQLSGRLTAGSPVPETPVASTSSLHRKTILPIWQLPGQETDLRHIPLRTSGVQVYEAQMSPGKGTMVMFPDRQL